MKFNTCSRLTAAGLAALWCLRAGLAVAQTPSLVELAQKEQERRKALKGTAAKAMLASGSMTAAEVARQIGCSPSTLYRHLPGGRGAIASADSRTSVIT